MPKVALITGGNRGLGQETAARLAALGWRVMITSRDAKAGLDAAKRIGGRTWAFELDVTAPPADFADRVRAKADGIDALVNNAGVYGRGTDPRVTLETNFYGPLRLTEALLPLLRGNVVNVSSGLGELSGFPRDRRDALLDPALTRDALVRLVESFLANRKGWPDAYSVSKAALNALTRIWARDFPQLRVVSVCPGWVRTRMGGRGATRSVEEGASGIVWAATQETHTGGFFRDAKKIPW